ncbi:MAG TPA: hypothetical protein DD435_01105 [Cyanobacteria bacterium UBA8530]|nr:hypothetical protein [Cyanobacteria bacterium UBA8530]
MKIQNPLPQTAPLPRLASPSKEEKEQRETTEALPVVDENKMLSSQSRGSELGKEALQALRKSGGTVLRQPEAPNSLHNLTNVKKALEADQEKEKVALSKLQPDQRTLYEKIKGLVSDAADMVRSLQRLLVDEKIPGKPDLKDGKDLLQNLCTLAEQPLAEGLDRESLVGHLLAEIADPATINQRNRNTCGAATAQILLAKNSPAEYVRLVSGLASPEGKVSMSNGDTLLREPGTEKADDSKRTASSRLLQPAFMEYANGKDDYDNATDLNTGKETYVGLYAEQMDSLLEASNGIKFDTVLVKEDRDVPAAMKKLEESADKGHATPILFDYPDAGGHFVGVTGVSAEKVNFINPWGQEEDMPRQDFEKRLWAVSIPQEKPQAKLHLPFFQGLGESLQGIWKRLFNK